ncbi:MAG: 4Fe-4S binding protein [Oscillospiraceae bacterium]|jgi:2-oxoglutarate ferredoxin oxidoreductase subunit delta|nr:4Fe-4S binding protein [Oscillospiraceae bacterium]
MPKIIVNETICKGCELCIGACPKKIIVIDKNTINIKGYHPAKLSDESECIGCSMCAMMCPDIAITVER